MQEIIIFTIAALVAETLGTVGGFGSSMLFVPLAGMYFDFQSVLGITAVFHVASNLSKIALFRNGFNWFLVIRMGIPSVIFVFAGAFLTRFANGIWLEISLGCFLVCMSLLLLLYRNFSLKPSSFNAVSGGILSGFIAGLLGTGGAVRGLALSAFNLEKEIFVSTSAFIDLGVDITRSIVYISNGFLHRHDLYLIPILVVVSIIGTFLGKKILERFSRSQFRNMVLFLILAVGITIIIKILFTTFRG